MLAIDRKGNVGDVFANDYLRGHAKMVGLKGNDGKDAVLILSWKVQSDSYLLYTLYSFRDISYTGNCSNFANKVSIFCNLCLHGGSEVLRFDSKRLGFCTSTTMMYLGSCFYE